MTTPVQWPETLQASAAPAAYPKEQLELIRRTVASGATNDELALFIYDCQRRGVHPLDRLLHYTKRGGKYTPVTSIDFMRAQAAASGEMAGSDDPVFVERGDATGVGHLDIVSATVVVYRITQGQRFAYSATARWAEYCPDAAPMWKRMPHTMLGKCAEALALRKAFPQQLAGLYAREEMDQADGPKGYVVEAPKGVMPSESTSMHLRNVHRDVPGASVTTGGGASVDEHADDTGGPLEPLPDGSVLIQRVDPTPTKNPNVKKYLITDSNGETYSTIREQLGSLCEQLAQERSPVTFETEATRWGANLVAVHRVERTIQTRDETYCGACGLLRDKCVCSIPF